MTAARARARIFCHRRATVRGVSTETAVRPQPLRLTQARIGDTLHDGGAAETPIKDVMHCYSGDVVGSFTVTFSASPSTSSKFCRGSRSRTIASPRPDPHRVERQASRPGPHHRGPHAVRRGRAAERGAPAAPRTPAHRPLIRHRRPRTRIAHHLPRPIRRQPHQPAGPAHVRLAIRSRTLPNRTATSARSRGDNPRAVDPPPAAAGARRIAARHADRSRHPSDP